MALHDDSIFQNKNGKIEILNFQGETKQIVPLSDSDGEITLMEIVGKHMVVVTANNTIRIWDVSWWNLKQVGMSWRFEKNGDSLGDIKHISINCSGKKIAIIAEQSYPSIKIPDTKFYVYDVDLDMFYDQEVEYNRVPTESSWDLEDERLLAVETEYMAGISKVL